MAKKLIETDERTTFVENISYKYGYNFIAFALLLDVMYRSYKLNQAAWDLLGIVIVSGLVMTTYQWKQEILGKTWIKTAVFTMALAIIIALVITVLR